MRYVDDIVIFVRSQKAGERVVESDTRFLRDRMKLQVNETKSNVERLWNMKFFGFRVTQMMGHTRLGIHPKALVSFKDKLREITRRTRGVSLSRIIGDLKRKIPGWLTYFRIGLSKKLNRWLIRRLRAFLLEQWKLPRTKVRNLKRLGINHRAAVLLGNTRKGPWRVSDYMQMNFALPAKWFEQHYGLIRFR